jgi:hypothetical protein
MAQYTRTTDIDSAPSGDTVKQAVLDLDTDLTGTVAAYNAHDSATTAVHGMGAATICGTSMTQTLTLKTISGGTLTGTLVSSGATITGGNTVNQTITTPTITGGSSLNQTITTPSITGGSSTNMTITTPAITGGSIVNMTIQTPTLTGAIPASGATISSPTITDAVLQAPIDLVLGSDADGDMYYRASSVLARLAKGTANLKMFMNAGATAPEWAAGIKIGTFTIDTATASGTQAIAAVGFKPSAVIFLANVDTTAQASIGFDNGTVAYVLYNNSAASAATWLNYSARSIELIQSAVIDYNGSITTLGADGFTITWVQNGLKTGIATIYYIAFR